MASNFMPDISGAPEKRARNANGVLLPFPIDKRAFECQPTESPQAYEAWSLYKELKYANQGGIQEVARRLSKSEALIKRWSVRWQWKERYRLYQNYKHIEEESLRRKEAGVRARQWATRTIEIRDKGFDVGKKLIERGESLLALPTFKREVRETIKIGDQEIPTVTYLIFNEHPKDGRQYIETGIKLQRLSAEMPTENLGLGFSPEDLDRDLDNMSPEDLLSYAAELEKIKIAEREAENKV